jgi:alpha-L-fucosidase 2
MEWSGKTLKKVTVFSKNGGKTVLVCGDKNQQLSLKRGQKIEILW